MLWRRRCLHELIQGRQQVLLLSNRGLTAVDPATGTVLWEHRVPLPPSAPRSVQPYPLGEAQVLIASEGDLGLALLDLKREGEAWTPAQRWVSREFRPSFNNFVVQDGHVYGFDGRIFACVVDSAGERWQHGRRRGRGGWRGFCLGGGSLGGRSLGSRVMARAIPG